MLSVEGEDARVDSRMLRDERMQQKQKQVSMMMMQSMVYANTMLQSCYWMK